VVSPRIICVALLASCLLGIAACSTGSTRSATVQPTALQTRPSTLRTEPEVTTGPTAVVKSGHANLREKPSPAGTTVTTLQKGSRLVLVGKVSVGPWYQVRELSSGETGWIHGNTISLVKERARATAPLSISNAERKVTAVTRSAAKAGRSYINVDGVRVRSPGFSDRPPSGASARCRDGTYSFSLNRRGTCSHHGGVGQWL
jgi:uncharacterized protein YgiM (DUF1202 family)